MKNLVLLFLLFFAYDAYAQKFEDLARTPPMGWNSWNYFQCNVNEAMIREMADAMVASGMKDAGYQYIVIDDCWHGERDEQGFIQPHPERFPSGMKALADYIHSLGLKFGIYSCAGYQTCAGYPGSRGFEYQDALTYAGWGVDYLKYDWCNTEGLNARGAFMTIRDALHAAGRPIVLSICEWGDNQPWEWGKDVGHLWRTTGDIHRCWDCEFNHGTWSSWGFLKILDMHEPLREHNGPGHWNDADMLQVGNGMAENMDRAHFGMWAMLATPLMAGNDLRDMTPETKDILTNKEVIAVNQDPLGIQAFKYRTMGTVDIWIKPLDNDAIAIAFLNRAEFPMDIEFDWAEHEIVDTIFGHEFDFSEITYTIRNLWEHTDIGTTAQALRITVPGNDIYMIRLSR
jgi:alpha-galactosidase